MKKVFYLWIYLGCLLVSCSKEPVFPDPGMDVTSNVRDTVRRDTIDEYFLEMRVSAPNGVKTIEVLNGLTYKTLETLDEYTGQKSFMLRYRVDLSCVTHRDSTLNYVIKVTDNDLRAYNRAFSIVVKRFSAPAIKISGTNGVLGLVSPVFELKALFETGLKTMKSYEILFKDEVVDEGYLGDTLSVYNYSKVLSLWMEKGPDYKLEIRLTDSEGTTNSEMLTLRLIDLKRPVQVTKYLHQSWGELRLARELNFHYNHDYPERLDSIRGAIVSNTTQGLLRRPFAYYFTYDEKGRVIRFEEWKNDSDGKWNMNVNWTYHYGEFGLDQIRVDDEYNFGTYIRLYTNLFIKRIAIKFMAIFHSFFLARNFG